jgi:vanZ family protein
MAYLVVLIRIVLFKQVALYNLFAAIGSMERTISIIPFKSLLDMINNNISVTRILENILGNIAIFIPFGLLLPIVQKDKSKKIILYGLITSALIEIIQYVFALGSSDIDDLMLNTLGTVIGYLLYKIIHKKARADTLTAISIIVLVTVLGGFALGILFINHTELFMLSSKEIVVENKNLVQDFIDTQPTVSGKFVKVNGNVLTLEKSIHSSTDTRTIMDLEITPNSNIYICYNKIDYFFSTISGEQISYEKIEYSDFLSQNSNSFTKENNVRIWSSDGKTIDNLVITEWIE